MVDQTHFSGGREKCGLETRLWLSSQLSRSQTQTKCQVTVWFRNGKRWRCSLTWTGSATCLC